MKKYKVYTSDKTLAFISENKDGNFYVGYKVIAPRSINAKANRKAEELLIVGIPKAKFPKYCLEHDIEIVEVDE